MVVMIRSCSLEAYKDGREPILRADRIQEKANATYLCLRVEVNLGRRFKLAGRER